MPSRVSERTQIHEDADQNTLRILLSTDNHLGYAERDPVRGMDSFAAFEEVLYLAKRFKVDMVLIAGDLFHENRPSRHTLYKTMEIIRRYCMGPDPVHIEILSDQAQNFRNVSGTVNYQDEFYSVDLPIFSIHGNHDDPSRDSGGDLLAALDLLAVSNLVNYFGRQEEVEKVQVSPVLIRKGTTHVALYGLGAMRDERLNRMWSSQKVRFLRPEEDVDDDEDGFFNIFCLHQNRDLGRGSKNCVQESMIPDWMDLVVWGHEHECLIDFFESVVGTFRISQPGSSVATSLVPGEAVVKKIGILDIQGKNFRMKTIPLTQVRSFVTTDICLREHRTRLDPDDPKIDEKVSVLLEEEVKVIVLNARDKMKTLLEDSRNAGNDAGEESSPLKYKLQKPHEILARLRVDHAGFTSLNNQRFGAKFVGEVANPGDILLFHRKRDPASHSVRAKAKTLPTGPILPEELEKINMEDLVRDYLGDSNNTMKLLVEKNISSALEEFVEKSAANAISEAATTLLESRQKSLIAGSNKVDKKTQILEIIEDESRARVKEDNYDAEAHDRQTLKRKLAGTRDEDDSVQHTGVFPEKENARGAERISRQKSKAEVSTRRAPTDSKRKAARRQKLVELDDEDESNPETTSSPLTRPKGRATKRSINDTIDDDESSADDEYEADFNDPIDEDEELDVIEVKEQKTASSRRRKTPTRSTKVTTLKKKVAQDLDDDDDDSDEGLQFGKAGVSLDDDWGSALTRSQR